MRTHLLSLATVFSIASASMAQPVPNGLQGQPGWAGGVITSVDVAARTISVTQGLDVQTYVLAPDAQVIAGKKALPDADLASGVGQQVRIRYALDGTTRTASRVSLLGAAKRSPAAASTQTPAATPTPQS